LVKQVKDWLADGTVTQVWLLGTPWLLMALSSIRWR
jgi:hypothetical protein